MGGAGALGRGLPPACQGAAFGSPAHGRGDPVALHERGEVAGHPRGAWAVVEGGAVLIRWARLGVWDRLLDLARERGIELGMAFLDGTSIRAHAKAAGAENVWPAPSASGFCGWPKTVCTNVSGLSAMPLTKMEIRAFCSS